MARRKTPREQQEEKKADLIAKYGVKQTTPNVAILLGRNEDKMKALTGDKNFGSTVKDAFVKSATLQAQNQTTLAQNTANNARNVANSYGAANAAYGNAYTQQAQNVGKTANQTVNHWASANAANSDANLQMGKQIGSAAKQTAQTYGSIWGATTGVTGSDQTGASIYGYRNDTQMSEPRSDWDVATRKEYRALKRTDPEDADAFAIGVNEGLNQAIRNQKEKALREWVSQSGAHGAAAWTGARGLNQISPLDSYNKWLERAAIGENRVYPDLTTTDTKEIIDDTNAGNIEDRFGKLGSLAYRGASWVADTIITNKVLGQELIPLGGGKVQSPNGKSKGIKTKHVASFLNVSDKIEEAIAGTKEWFDEKEDDIEKLAAEYRAKGMTESKARNKATRELLEDSYRKSNSRNR